MATLPPPATNYFPANSLEKQCYGIAEMFSVNIPIMNDRNRLGFNLYKYMKGEGDKPEILVKSAKIKIVGISKEELASKISEALKKIEFS
jgi:hypothetical protein